MTASRTHCSNICVYSFRYRYFPTSKISGTTRIVWDDVLLLVSCVGELQTVQVLT